MASNVLHVCELMVRAVRVPMAEPHRTASGTIAESPLVLTDLRTREGVVGHSYVFTYTPAALLPTAALIKNLEPLIAGEVVAPLAIAHRLAPRLRLLGAQGLTGIAMAAVDMAAWDALARAAALPLFRLLGAAARPTPVYGAVGYEGARGSAATAARWRDRGIASVKAKIGYPTVEEDVAVVRAMREAAGPDAAIMVDYNQSLTPVAAAERAGRLDHEGLAWIEEPTAAEDHAGLARIAAAAHTPIQAGENWWGPHDMMRAIAARATDYVMPDVMKIGGVTGWMRAAALADAHAIPLSSHLFPEISAHLLCASPTAHWLEYSDWWNPILDRPLAVEDGHAVLDETRPGSGVAWDEAAVARYAVA
ncbi:MAG: mandelate racemase [Alphaproteobacteria bacterium]|nr:mandelate racemase [Alphaproteobacteria bacterium]